MPHSSGGGSHGGGSHGGSGSIGPAISKTYRKGYHRFVVYEGIRPRYFYSDRETIRPSDTRFTILDALLWLIYPLLFLMFLVPDLLRPPEKLPQVYTQTEIIIEDSTDQLTDREERGLREVFEQFQDKTGITPALITFQNSSWQGRSASFERVAYDTYVSMFRDESHWLICYSSDPGSTGFDDWYWEGMQGDKTDSILKESITDTFTKNVQRYLTDREHYSIGEAFIQGFRDIEPKLMKRSIESTQIWIGVMSIAICAFGIVTTYNRKKQLAGLEGALRCPSDTFPVTEEPCTYCGGIYVRGIQDLCPYCGAPIPQEGAIGGNVDRGDHYEDADQNEDGDYNE